VRLGPDYLESLNIEIQLFDLTISENPTRVAYCTSLGYLRCNWADFSFGILLWDFQQNVVPTAKLPTHCRCITQLASDDIVLFILDINSQQLVANVDCVITSVLKVRNVNLTVICKKAAANLIN
jgi:hypothetical protein